MAPDGMKQFLLRQSWFLPNLTIERINSETVSMRRPRRGVPEGFDSFAGLLNILEKPGSKMRNDDPPCESAEEPDEIGYTGMAVSCIGRITERLH